MLNEIVRHIPSNTITKTASDPQHSEPPLWPSTVEVLFAVESVDFCPCCHGGAACLSVYKFTVSRDAVGVKGLIFFSSSTTLLKYIPFLEGNTAGCVEELHAVVRVAHWGVDSGDATAVMEPEACSY